jgi:hypothetical protein
MRANYSGCAPGRDQEERNPPSVKSKRIAVRPYSGHAPGHARDAFIEAVERLLEWDGTGPEPLVDFEVNYEPVQITIGQACHLMSRCTDILPGYIRDHLEEFGLKTGTHSAGARAVRVWLAKKRLPAK